MTADLVQAIAAVATFLAAAAAVFATFRAPRLAAKFAEDLRIANQKADEERRLKLWVFTTLMQFRRQIINPSAVAALNLIDVVFCDNAEVRNAWRSFSAAVHETPYSPEKVSERYHSILEKMARGLGLHESISIADIQNAYYPEGLGQLDEATYLETQEKLQRLRSTGVPGIISPDQLRG